MSRNPFVSCTAKDMNYEEVSKYWCSPFSRSKSLDEELMKRSITPIFLEGARGSGKTMLLKHISYFCQSMAQDEFAGGSRIRRIEANGYLGIYLNYKIEFATMLDNINGSQHYKDQLFQYHYELLMAREVIKVLKDILEKEIDGTMLSSCVNKALCETFNREFLGINEAFEHINDLIYQFGVDINRLSFSSTEIIEPPAAFLKKMFECIRKYVDALRSTTMVLIIDEYENIGPYQKVLNSLIKQVDNETNITYRIGYRPGGIYTYETNIGKENLAVDRDFMLQNIRFENQKDYKEFLKEVANRRLSSDGIDSIWPKDITKILGPEESYEDEARSIVSKNKKKHFHLLREHFPKLSRDKMKALVQELSYEENPLLEMLNILWCIRGKSPHETREAMEMYLKKDYTGLGKKYRDDYVNKYKLSLLFLLASIYRKRKQYYSFNTFAYLSGGSVKNFISLCRNTFFQLDEAYFDRDDANPLITMEHQTKGASATAEQELSQLKQSRDYGEELFNFTFNMGNFLSLFHKDKRLRYPETNQFGLKRETDITSNSFLNPIFTSLIRWGAIVEKPKKQRLSLSENRRGSLFYLNRIYSPVFNISCRTRGGYNPLLSKEIFEEMITTSLDPGEIWIDIVEKKSTTESTEEGANQLCLPFT